MSIEKQISASRNQKTAYLVKPRILGEHSYAPGKSVPQPIEGNSFGLPAVISCPGATEFCKEVCYAQERKIRPKAQEKVMQNLEVLEGETIERMTQKINLMLNRYTRHANTLDIPEDRRNFRIHWDGDFFSTDYATSWRNAIGQQPDITFWAYTRSFTRDVNVVPILSDIDNLNLFMSVDLKNVERAAEVISEYPDVRVAYLVDYADDVNYLRKILGRTEDYRAFACPENVIKPNGQRRIALVSEKGGACQRCQYCIGKHDKWDLISLVRHGLVRPRPQDELPFEDSIPFERPSVFEKAETLAQPIGETALQTETLFKLY